MSTSGYSSPSRPPRRRLLVIIVIVVVLAIVVWGIASRIIARNTLKKQTAAAAITTVTTYKVKKGGDSEELVLPGTVQAFVDAPIYARTNGYLKRWYVDIGGPVKAGELLAEIDTPEVDQQLHQAEADLATAEANNQLAQTTAKRWKDLLDTDSVSKQDAEDRSGDAAAKKAQLASSQANLARLREMEGFKRVLAPFDGTLTARNVDVGALINSGSGSSSGPELFHVADTRKLRIYVQVPQTYAGETKPGLEAELHFTDHPGQTFPAKLVRSANAIDVTQRTLLVELQTDNANGNLLAGGYTEVHFKLPTSGDNIRMPSNALIFRGDGLQVAVLDGNDKVALKSIKLGRDFGNEVEVLDGLKPGDTIVINPPDSITADEQVHVSDTPAKSGGDPKKPVAGGDVNSQDKSDDQDKSPPGGGSK